MADNTLNSIISYGLQNKKKKDEILSAILKSGQVDVGTAVKSLKDLSDYGAFDYQGAQGGQETQNLNVGGPKITSAQASSLGDAKAANEMLGSLETNIGSKAGKKAFAPISGTLRTFNPWDTDVQTIQSQINATKQIVGKFLEGGVLRAEDEAKYEKILPKIGDTNEVAQEKLNQVKNLIKQKYEAQTGTLGEAGYDISGLAKSQQPRETATQQQQTFKQDEVVPGFDAAMAHARQNPNDPNSQKLIQAIRSGQIDPITGQKKSTDLVSGATGESEQTGTEKSADLITKLGEVGQTLGDFFGGNQWGKAIGDVIGTQLAKHGEAGENFKNNIANIEKIFQEGKITEEQKNKLLDSNEQIMKDAFGYKGPSFRQLAADTGKIALSVLGTPELKGATALGTAAKVGAFGFGQGALQAQSEGEGLGGTIEQGIGGALLAEAGLGAGKVLGKAFDVVSGKSQLQNLSSNVAKAIGMTGKMTPKAATESIPRATNALATIAEEAKGMTVKDIDGVEKVFDPRKATFGETLQALVHTKNNLYQKYTELAKQAGEKGANLTQKDLDGVIGKLQGVAEGSTSAVKNSVKGVIKDLQDNFKGKGNIDFAKVQKYIEDLNVNVNPMSDKAGAEVSGKASSLLREILDSKIQNATGGQYQALRNKYADIKGIENSLVNQFKKASRDIGKGVGGWVENVGGVDALVGAMTGNIGQAATGVGLKGMARMMNYLKSPETKLQKVFQVIEKQAQKEGGYGNLSDKITRLMQPQEAGKLEQGIRSFNREMINKTKGLPVGMSIKDVSGELGAQRDFIVNSMNNKWDDIIKAVNKGKIDFEDFGDIERIKTAFEKGKETPVDIRKLLETTKRAGVDLGYKAEMPGVVAGLEKKASTAMGKTAESNLIKEAKKYKSAEEFVKAQGEILYHGSKQKYEKFDLSKADKGGLYGNSAYMTPDAKRALSYGDNVTEYVVPKNAKLLKEAEFEKRVNSIIPSVPYRDITIARKKAVEQFINEGYDGVKTGNTTAIFNQRALQTKSQLTDIWNQANKK